MQKNHKEITYCREAEGNFSVTLNLDSCKNPVRY